LRAAERDEQARAAWRERAAAADPARFVFVDESGSNLGLTPRYARAPKGERAVGTAPRNRGKNTTTVAALTPAGMGPALMLEGGVTKAAFEAYVEGLLAPTLRPGQIVVLDNLAAHKGERTRTAIEARGAEVWFLPAYSPDLTPIEEAFAKLKALLRRAEARSQEALTAAVRTGLRAITPADARGWFRHSGYPLQAQLV
jgi:transposase